MLSRQDKQEKIERLTRRLEGAGILIIAENRGVSAGEMDVFRRQFSESDGTVQVVKNTLARLVLKDGAFAALDGHLRGPLVYGVGADASLVAKKFADMARDNQSESGDCRRRPAVRGIHERRANRSPRQTPLARSVAGTAARHHAGAHQRLCPHAQRGAHRLGTRIVTHSGRQMTVSPTRILFIIKHQTGDTR